jgi:hypothetical protein
MLQYYPHIYDHNPRIYMDNSFDVPSFTIEMRETCRLIHFTICNLIDHPHNINQGV